MRKEVLIIKNTPNESPGLIEELLKEKEIPYRSIEFNDLDPLPPLNTISAIIVMGGPDSANDTTKKMLRELVYIRNALSRNIPYLGICLGLQTLVKAAGGNVIKAPFKEVGLRDPKGNFFTATITEMGREDPLLQGLASNFIVFHLHGETVELTQTMKLLAMGKHCQNQIVKVGQNAYGMQCHLELTEELFEFWLTEDSDLKKLPSEKVRQDFKAIFTGYSNTGRRIFENFFRIADTEMA